MTTMRDRLTIRPAQSGDLGRVTEIHNAGITCFAESHKAFTRATHLAGLGLRDSGWTVPSDRKEVRR